MDVELCLLIKVQNVEICSLFLLVSILVSWYMYSSKFDLISLDVCMKKIIEILETTDLLIKLLIL